MSDPSIPGSETAFEPADRVTVYVLHHVHPGHDGAGGDGGVAGVGGDDDDNAKLIGIYSTAERAQAAVERLRPKPGFRDHPEGFQIDEMWLDRDSWQEGFITWHEALTDS